MVDPAMERLARIEVVIAGLAGDQRQHGWMGNRKSARQRVHHIGGTIRDRAFPHDRRVQRRPVVRVRSQVDIVGQQRVHRFFEARHRIALAH